MDLALALQYLVIALAVLASVWVVAHKQFPNATRRLRGRLALALIRERRPAWLRALGRRIAPAIATGTDGCGGCSHCGPSAPRKR